VTGLDQSPVVRPPSVDAIARVLAVRSSLPHPLLVQSAREAIAEGGAGSITEFEDRASEIARRIELLLIRDAVNATGVLLHTNLGRAPMSVSGSHRSITVEFDLLTGARGSRHESITELMRGLIGAEAAVVVNNNAAAVLLVLAALADQRDVVVSRGESVEIGGGFRIPDVMEQSGARLIDVGTTNKTRLRDYEKACSNKRNDVALVMKIHPSNFAMQGFVEATTVKELAALQVPVVVDIGSGLLDSSTPWVTSQSRSLVSWLSNEPAAKQALDDGASLVLFSGDKLLGGPQCGVIAGKKELVEQCARHPLMRALRPGSHTLLGLQEVLLQYLSGTASSDIAFWEMATSSIAELRERAVAICQRLHSQVPSADALMEIIDSDALPGAGSAPGVSIPSVAITIKADVVEKLRGYAPPVIARQDRNHTVIDMRSFLSIDDDVVVDALVHALS
jgi:L-seryl-tRNA(Ser) seleniumtransferase